MTSTSGSSCFFALSLLLLLLLDASAPADVSVVLLVFLDMAAARGCRATMAAFYSSCP
jgi:hypothetical protein